MPSFPESSILSRFHFTKLLFVSLLRALQINLPFYIYLTLSLHSSNIISGFGGFLVTPLLWNMTQALSSHLGVRLPSPYGPSSSSFGASSSSSRSLNVPRSFKPVKVMASGDIRDKLEHHRRPPMSPSHLKRRVAQPVELWDRFPTAKEVQQMMETMERMMEDPFAFSTGEWPMPASDRGRYPRGRTPWEVKEGEKEYKMRFDMPGMTKEDVKVWVEEKMLVVKAEKERKKNGDEGEEEDDEGEVWSAKSYGRYNSRIVLPENIAFEKIKAEVKDGVLYITIPKASSFSKILDIHVQ